LLLPADFVEVAESSGLIDGLGRLVIDHACRQMRRWVDAGIAPETISVNVSAVQFKSPLVLEREITSILQETKLPPKCLEIELTETALMDKSSAQLDVLRQLRAKGIKLAIDDFGTGFSSLDYLRQLRVDRIKIAQVFMTNVVDNENDAHIVHATVALAHALSTGVIAEGVETREQVDLLRSWNCEQAQGFYYSKPLDADAITTLLRNGTDHNTVVVRSNVA
jgi:EAL domain-containing protein (putative c-di-GMP-specific phosphodiesterase class I)